MANLYIAPLSKALYNLCLSFTRSHTHSHTNGYWLPCKVPTSLSGAIGGLGVLLRDTWTRPGWDRTGNPPTARRQPLNVWLRLCYNTTCMHFQWFFIIHFYGFCIWKNQILDSHDWGQKNHMQGWDEVKGAVFNRGRRTKDPVLGEQGNTGSCRVCG